MAKLRFHVRRAGDEEIVVDLVQDERVQFRVEFRGAVLIVRDDARPLAVRLMKETVRITHMAPRI